jgi:SAM-dependent methyltransferase
MIDKNYSLSAKLYDKLHAGEVEILAESLTKYFFDLGISEGSTILDLGSGTGTLLGQLSNHGLCGTGIEVVPEMVKEAKRKYPSLNFILMDFCCFELDQKFDVILCTNDSINNLEPDARGDFFTRIEKHLNPGGKCYIDFDTETDITSFWQDQKSVNEGQGWKITRSNFYDQQRCLGTEVHDWVVSKNGKTHEFTEVHKLYPLSPSDVSELAKNAAMRVVNFIEPTKFRMVDESLDSYLRLGCVLMANVK